MFPNLRIKNRGIGSDATEGLLARLDSVVKTKPSKIFLMIGINDIAGGISEETIWDNYQRIVIKLKNELSETELYIESLLPCGNEKGDLYNTKIVSLNEKFVDKKGYLKAEYNYDNVHITIDGYSLLYNEVRKYI